MNEKQWVRCPCCGGKTRLMIAETTVLKELPLFCPKCKQETVIDVKHFHVTLSKHSS